MIKKFFSVILAATLLVTSLLGLQASAETPSLEQGSIVGTLSLSDDSKDELGDVTLSVSIDTCSEAISIWAYTVEVDGSVLLPLAGDDKALPLSAIPTKGQTARQVGVLGVEVDGPDFAKGKRFDVATGSALKQTEKGKYMFYISGICPSGAVVDGKVVAKAFFKFAEGKKDCSIRSNTVAVSSTMIASKTPVAQFNAKSDGSEHIPATVEVSNPLAVPTHPWDSGKVTTEPTCGEDGEETYTCTKCGETFIQPISATGKHTEVTKVTKATFKTAGKVTHACSVCSATTQDSEVIPAVSQVKLSATAVQYTGKDVTVPSVTVKDSKGKTLTKGKDYTVTYPKPRKAVGKSYTVTVTLLESEHYKKSTTKLTFKIVPKATKITKVSAISKGFKVTWAKQKTGTTGYILEYSTDKNFKKSVKKVTVKKNTTTSYTVKKLSGKKKYYVRIRTMYKTSSYASKVSATKSVTTKK